MGEWEDRSCRGEFLALEEELLALLRRGVGASLREGEFNELALRVFRFQCKANRPYRSFVRRRGVEPEEVDRWESIPPLPTRAFKVAPLVAGELADVQEIFRTSGTTRGEDQRGEHHLLSREIYRASLTPNFRAHLLPEGYPLPVLALLPSPEEAPSSSLSFMLREAAGWWPGEGSGFFFHPEEGIRADAFRQALARAQKGGQPVLLAGTAFAFAHWVEMAGERGWTYRLPGGSRVMETGGFKGRARERPRAVLYAGLEEAFGVPAGRMVNEYGMTELLSQFYEPALIENLSLEGRYHRPPPWVRTRVLHPVTLEALPPGERGILAHLDLANLGSVSAVLTEDLAVLVDGGFRLEGRSPGAEPRGCSLAMEDFLSESGVKDAL